MTAAAAAVNYAPEFIPSAQQQVFFDWIVFGKGSCVVEAVAGSGKTTTLVWGLKLMSGWIFFGAYNKKIADEIASKVNLPNVMVSTMHAAGLRIWKQVAGSFVKIDGKKCNDIFDALVDDEDQLTLKGAVVSLVSFAKQAAFNVERPSTTQDWFNLIDHFSVETLDREDEVITLAKMVLARSVQQDKTIIDFEDMIYAPLIHKCQCKTKYDWVLLDEAQDTNASRRALALLMLKEGGRLVAVGDRHQAIYGFTGADSDALDLIAQAVNAQQIPLTTSYRCPKKITELARTYVNHIQSHEDAAEGKIDRLAAFEDVLTSAKIGDAILCRFNAPIIQLAYAFIGNGITAKVEGREIGANLKTLACKWKVKTIAAISERLDAYREKQMTKLLAAGKETQAAGIEDKVKCMFVLIDRVAKVNPNTRNVVTDICNEIDAIFGDNIDSRHCVLLSTIHKSKGREWKKVFWIQGSSAMAKQDWEKECERNLAYVAITRAQEELVLVPQPPKDVKSEDLVKRCVEDMTDKGI